MFFTLPWKRTLLLPIHTEDPCRKLLPRLIDTIMKYCSNSINPEVVLLTFPAIQVFYDLFLSGHWWQTPNKDSAVRHIKCACPIHVGSLSVTQWTNK